MARDIYSALDIILTEIYIVVNGIRDSEKEMASFTFSKVPSLKAIGTMIKEKVSAENSFQTVLNLKEILSRT